MKDTPKYLAIAEKLKHEIETGEYQPNDQLPKEFDLARSYNVSRITVRNAMKELESQGLIYRIQGAGTYVKERNLMHATVDSNQLELINLKKYKLKLLDFEVGQVIPKITEALNVQPYDIVYTIKRAAMATNKQEVKGQVEEKEPLLKWLQKSYLSGGRAFEWNETYYRITKFPIKEAIVL